MKNLDQEFASEFSANLNSGHFTSVNKAVSAVNTLYQEHCDGYKAKHATVSSQAVNGTTQRIYIRIKFHQLRPA